MEIPYELLIKHCKKETTEKENEEIEEWLSEPANRDEFEKLKREWKYIDEPTLVMPDKELLWKKIEKHNHSFPPKRHLFIKYLVAAAIITGFLTGIYIFRQPGDPAPESRSVFASGQKLEKVMDDSSSIWLNTDSELYYNSEYNIYNREIRVKGELFLDIKPSDIPCIVFTENIYIRVLGTAFTINTEAENNTLRIHMKKGSIAVYKRADNELLLNLIAPQSVSINKERPDSYHVENGKENEEVWAQEKLTMNNEPLSRIIKKLESWYGVRIKTDGLNLQKHYTFYLSGEDIQEFLQMFSSIEPIDYHISEKEVSIKRKR